MSENKTNAPTIKLPVRISRYETDSRDVAEIYDDKSRLICTLYSGIGVRNSFADEIVAALNEADALRAEVEMMRQILSGEHLQIQFNKGDYRFHYHDYGDTKAMWCAFNMRDGKYIGDPQRFYPLLELLDLHAAIKPNAAEEGTE